MTRCFVESAQWPLPEIRLTPEESHHLRVLRARLGDRIELLTGQGHIAQAEIVDQRRNQVHVRVLPETRHAAPPPTVILTLIQAIPKHALMDWIIEKATELGLAVLAPVISERVIARPMAAECGRRRERWQKIARAAARQCGTAWLPTVDAIRPLSEALREMHRFDLCCVGSLHAQARPFRAVVSEVKVRRPRRIALVIGPEGDLTDAEYEALRDAGASLVSFGRRVLRVETAALYGLSLLNYEFAE
jgi:16S rRNA (uracil1498-N3)-methyltransferase